MNQNEYMTEADQQPQPYSIRLPLVVRRQLEESARQGGRSLHAEILQRLMQSLGNNDTKNNDSDNSLDEHIRQIATEVVQKEIDSRLRTELARLGKV